MHVVAQTEARKIEVVRAGDAGHRFDYIGSPDIINTDPQAFLVDRLYSGARIEPHFHDIDQLQVVVGGACRRGRKAANPVTRQ